MLGHELEAAAVWDVRLSASLHFSSQTHTITVGFRYLYLTKLSGFWIHPLPVIKSSILQWQIFNLNIQPISSLKLLSGLGFHLVTTVHILHRTVLFYILYSGK